MAALPLSRQTEGSTFRFFSRQALGVVGVAQPVDFDLTGDVTPGSAGLPQSVREDPTFRDNWIGFVKQTDTGITAVELEPEFLPAAPAIPTTIRIFVDSDSVDNAAEIEFWYIHSIIR